MAQTLNRRLQKRREVISKLIRQIRLKRGLSQEDLAPRIGLTIPALSNIETGSAVPSEETLYLLCRATGTPLSTFHLAVESRVPVASEVSLDELLQWLNEPPMPKRPRKPLY
jgi:transcriptional regulator with XRE-family HTH domain